MALRRTPRIPDDSSPLPGEDAYYGSPVDEQSVDARAWHGIGRRLYLGRKHHQISKREAARRAGVSEALWRLLEDGGRMVDGRWVIPNPRPENLLGVVRAVGLNPESEFREADLPLPPSYVRETHDDRLAHKITHLSDRDRRIVERLVDAMLNPDDSDDQPGTDHD